MSDWHPEAVALYATGKWTMKRIAIRFGVSTATVSAIISPPKQCWRDRHRDRYNEARRERRAELRTQREAVND